MQSNLFWIHNLYMWCFFEFNSLLTLSFLSDASFIRSTRHNLRKNGSKIPRIFHSIFLLGCVNATNDDDGNNNNKNKMIQLNDTSSMVIYSQIYAHCHAFNLTSTKCWLFLRMFYFFASLVYFFSFIKIFQLERNAR